MLAIIETRTTPAEVMLMGGFAGAPRDGRVRCSASGRVVWRGLRLVRLSKQEWVIFLILAAARGERVSVVALLDACYGQDPDGGPEAADLCIRQCVRKLRLRLAPLGLIIPNNYGWGYALLDGGEPQ
jgi:DNA-binding response OmpR family regulator